MYSKTIIKQTYQWNNERNNRLYIQFDEVKRLVYAILLSYPYILTAPMGRQVDCCTCNSPLQLFFEVQSTPWEEKWVTICEFATGPRIDPMKRRKKQGGAVFKFCGLFVVLSSVVPEGRPSTLSDYIYQLITLKNIY